MQELAAGNKDTITTLQK